jgi:hypothetical protein
MEFEELAVPEDDIGEEVAQLRYYVVRTVFIAAFALAISMFVSVCYVFVNIISTSYAIKKRKNSRKLI